MPISVYNQWQVKRVQPPMLMDSRFGLKFTIGAALDVSR
jgi:hypothetical protein